MTGWFNIVGLVGIVASVDYGAAFFLNATARPLRRRHLRASTSPTASHILAETWLLFFLILVFYTR